MRIISGIYKGKIISVPKHFNSRPTTDFAKESLFNILNNSIDFSAVDVLDLFTGTGNISYEFLSRGCCHVTCVELSKQNVYHLKELFSPAEIKAKVTILNHDALRFCKKGDLKQDLIFADPPYDYPYTRELLQTILENPSLKSTALIVIEHSGRMDFAGHSNLFRTERYGEVHFSFFRMKEN
jgi:16S rRNA (guanine(966)-N(2))-methyltransferase RsmD